MRRRRTAAVATALAAAALAGCSDDGSASSPTPAPTAPATSSASPSPQATTTPVRPDPDRFTHPPSGLVDEDTGETITPEAVPQWDADSRATALRAAEAVMSAFARPDLSHDQWWTGLEPLLSAQARIDYAYVDPANVPATQVTGTAELAEESSAYIARVQVPTDIGTYTLILSRADAEAGWLAERITPPEEVS